jgi:hypothetical protein
VPGNRQTKEYLRLSSEFDANFSKPPPHLRIQGEMWRRTPTDRRRRHATLLHPVSGLTVRPT